MLFEVKDLDKNIYEQKIRDNLPSRVIDCHTHVWVIPDEPEEASPGQRLVTWPARVAEINPIEDLMESYRLLLPGKQVVPLIFANVRPTDRIDELNVCTREAAQKASVPSLLLTDPGWSPELLEKKLIAEKRQGIKVYLNLAPAYIPGDEIRIFDFLPHAHLEVLDRLGLIVLLHIPRPGRLKDPVNIAQILEIEERYQNLHLILAHVGRAYCEEDVGDALDILSETKRLVTDISASTNAWVFARALEALGPERLLFGSDLPVTRMRMRRICKNGMYINLIPKGLYGDVSGDKNMGEVEGEEAQSLTFFFYEEILALLGAAAEVGLSKDDLANIFYGNAKRIFEAVGFRPE